MTQDTQTTLREWEIFRNYSTQLDVTLVDVDAAALALVKTGVAEATLTSDGACHWRKNKTVASGSCEMRVGAAYEQGEIKPPQELLSADFPLEAIGQGCWYRFAELRVFGDAGLPPRYVRAFLGECTLHSGNHRVTVYPMLKIYETGVISIAFRLIGPDVDMPLGQFISEFVQIAQREFKRADVPPGVVAFAPISHSDLTQANILGRARLVIKQWLHEIEVRSRTRAYRDGDFSFESLELPRGETGKEPETLVGLALTILHTAAYVIGSDRRGLALVALGPRKGPSIMGQWRGRSHIYLVRYSGQEETASGNEARHVDTLAAILAGLPKVKEPRRWIPPNLRTATDDIGFYVTETGSLLVFAKQALDRVRGSKRGDPNRGDLIYEEQAKMEMLEYGYALHRRIAELSQADAGDSEVVRQLQRELLHVELAMVDTGRYGEIRDLLAAGWSKWGVPELRDIAKRGLEMLRLDASDRATAASARISIYLAALAVVLAFEPVERLFVKPLWLPAGLPLLPEAFMGTVQAVVAIVVLLAIVLLIEFVGRRIRR